MITPSINDAYSSSECPPIIKPVSIARNSDSLETSVLNSPLAMEHNFRHKSHICTKSVGN